MSTHVYVLLQVYPSPLGASSTSVKLPAVDVAQLEPS